ncbi:receptor-type tyrosine-protein phosphatase kappa-like [Ruditapes philippinarum]|uniref:receptor-type tyrosine-protein phosphatase kappa-like n=1 Tax=Ruditapes philippinarum TaxID=129788 RepID=UPI00295BCFA1|nr:receptor-type tyrosine-protein phosphatase kappa-like [Ruditapes philippinarum]
MKYHNKFLFVLSFVVVTAVGTLSTDWHFMGPNIALHKPAVQSPGTFENYSASLVVDGNENSDFIYGSCSHTSGLSYYDRNYGNAQWKVDLRGSFNVSGVIIVNRRDLKYRLDGFQVFGFVSNGMGCIDGWCQLYDDKEHNKYNEDVIEIPVDTVILFSSVAIILPKRRSQTDNDKIYLTLCEVKIYAAPPTVCESSEVSHGGLKPNKPFFEVSTVATVYCEYGYKAKYPTITCLKTTDNGARWNVKPKCVEIKCVIPANPANGLYTIGTNTNVQNLTVFIGTSISGTCLKGYDIINGSTRVCLNNTEWSGKPFVCKIKQCSDPERIANGEYRFANDSVYSKCPLNYNSKIYLICNIGYTFQGTKERLCNDQKMWTGNAKCKINTCKSPENPANAMYIEKKINGSFAKYTGGELNYLDMIRVHCNTGHVNNASISVIQCLENKLWSGELGHCIQVTCRGLEQLKDGFYNYSKDALSSGYPYKTIVTAACNDRFKLSNPNNKSRTCTMYGKWGSEPVTCMRTTDTSTDTASQNTNAPLIGGVSAAIVLVLSAIVAVVFILYRRRKKDDKIGKPKPYAQLWEISSNDRHTSNSEEDVYTEIQDTSVNTTTDSPQRDGTYSYVKEKANTNIMKHSDQNLDSFKSESYYSFTNVNNVPKTAILVKDLCDLILTGFDAKRKFDQEFNELPQGMVRPHKEALKKENIIKNRYMNLYAYDDTRVVLKTDEASQSDYINACYVHGFTKLKQYIASQGPTKEILLDFWRMIWQEESSMIVMLTNLIEEGKEKCEQYWPNEGTSHMFGNIKVRTEKIDNFSQFVKRTLQVKKEGSKQKPRTVTQYHFTAWPDKGVPKNASSLVQFMSRLKHDIVEQNGPIVVHCSAGVARTGIFIALDFLTEQGKVMRYIDVFGTITAFRSQRVCLVQTLDQYIFLHQALIESLMLSTSALPAYKFQEAFKEVIQLDKEKKKSNLTLEFETLKKVSPVADEGDYVSSKLVNNRRKNRYSDVLPVEEFMPSLLSTSSDSDNRYINAVFLPSYKERKAFIITQTPLETTKEDFWDLIWEHDVHTVVMMNNIKETVDSEKYWPEKGESFTFGNIEITEDGVETKNHHQLVSLTATKQKVTRKIKQIRCGGWSYNHSLPDSPDVILTLLDIVKVWQRQSGHHTIVVHCMNGVDKSGLYCVISAVIEHLQIEQDVAISQVIQEMRNARKQIIPSVEQYKFCHETVLEFIHQFDRYSNLT